MAAHFTFRQTWLLVLVAGLLSPSVNAQQFGGEERGSGFGQRGRRAAENHRTALGDVIRSTIAPSTWDQVGGEGSLAIVEPWGIAVISQTRTVHNNIDALLATIRTVRAQQDGVDPPEARSVSVDEVYSRESVKKIETALRAATTLNFSDIPLANAVEEIQHQQPIPFAIDRRALEDSGLTPTVPVEVKVSGVSLQSALNLLLEDVGLTFVISNEVLMITTPDAADSLLVTRVYPVRDLLTD